MDSAIVTLYGLRVGQLSRLSEDYDFKFEFAPEYVTTPRRSTLGQFFEDQIPDPVSSSGLMCWFAHLLPQGLSRVLFQKWHDLDQGDDDDFDLLLAMGTDLPGAVEMQPATSDVRSPATRRRSPPRKDGVPAFGLAGVQTKLSVRQGDSGLVIPTWGEDGDFIAKFHDPRFAELPRLEHATTRWARCAGVGCHDTQLVSASTFVALPEGLALGDETVLLLTRFDRTVEGKVHVEDFGQILGVEPSDYGQYSKSYDDLGRVLRALSPSDLREYVRRVAFMLVSGNGDAHLKNWGVVYTDGRTPVLSPAYDLISTVCRIPDDQLALELAGAKKWEAIDAERIRLFLASFHEDVTVAGRWFHAAVDRAVDEFRARAGTFGFSDAEITTINAHIANVTSRLHRIKG